MERESFEDEEVAELLNREFVAIKVDREERPDIDHIYMAVCQALTGHGGWPLTVILTPEKKPVFAGTYYPKRRRYGRIGLMELLEQLADKWHNERDKVLEAGESITAGTLERMIGTEAGELDAGLLDQAFRMHEQTFDERYGGFGDAPKFPTPHHLMLLLRDYDRLGDKRALAMAEKTLDAMHRGGLYDHVGFGFARYSTDEKWLVPHFEKMLYDNALLIMAYLEAYQVTGKPKYAGIAEQVLTYVMRDMTSPEGAFYSAEDADSEGVEGKFYVWTPSEVIAVLGDDLGELFCECYDITPEGNFEGRSIPNLIETSMERIAQSRGITEEELAARLEAAREKLFEYRETRIHPHKDDKVLTSWNGLMIAAFAKAGKVLSKPEYIEAAQRAASFALTTLRREDGRLLARYRDGEAAYLGYVDDYAFLTWGLIELYEATFELPWMEQAARLTREMLGLFWDEGDGGLFFSGHDAEQLLSRTKEIYDGALPSGNSAAALNLQRLAAYTGDSQFASYAEKQLKAFAGTLKRYPIGHTLFLAALDYAFGERSEIVLAGHKEDERAIELARYVQGRFLPRTAVVWKEEGDRSEAFNSLFPGAADKTAPASGPAVYVCRDYACQAPVSDIKELSELLK